MSWFVGLIIIISILGFFLGFMAGWLLIWRLKLNKLEKATSSFEKAVLAMNKFSVEVSDLKNTSKEIKETVKIKENDGN